MINFWKHGFHHVVIKLICKISCSAFLIFSKKWLFCIYCKNGSAAELANHTDNERIFAQLSFQLERPIRDEVMVFVVSVSSQLKATLKNVYCFF